MKIYKLRKYAEEGVLSDVDDADFLARKLGAEARLDFSNIESVTADFLDHLLDGQALESLDGRIIGQEGSVEKELIAWVDRQESISEKKEKDTSSSSTIKKEKKKESKEKRIKYNRPELEGERYTPTRLVARLRQQLSSYIESAYPLSDPILVKARRKLLNQASDGRLLAQEPYVETTPRYKGFSGNYNDLGLAPHVADLFSELSEINQQYAKSDENKPLVYPEMYQHQADSFHQFLNEKKDIIVATGTGSGKTE